MTICRRSSSGSKQREIPPPPSIADGRRKRRRASCKIRYNTIARVSMTCSNRLRFAWILCLAAAGASHGQTQEQSHEKFVCTSGVAKRVVSIHREASNGRSQLGACRVDYTKDGQTKTLWSSSNGYAYCVAKAVALVTKLSQDNFSCKPEAVQPLDAVRGGSGTE